MTPKESFIAALTRQAPRGRVPHFELEFFLTMEAFGRVHPSQRQYRQWDQMSEREQTLHRKDVADLHVTVARRYDHAGMLFHVPEGWQDQDTRSSIEHIRELSGQDYLITLHGDATYALPDGNDMMDFVMKISEQPKEMKEDAQRRVNQALERGAQIKSWGVLDGFCLCADYCFNDNPFLSPGMFDDFVTPYLAQLVAGYRELGFYVIKHTDGNIMPILDSLVSTRPHALHSIDPQGGVELAEVKRQVGDEVCLIGNVNCALLQTGTDDEAAADVRRALAQGMPGGGYVFGTSNCIYTGMSLERYELMLDIWRREGSYDRDPPR
ncbi:MAG: uroporphyrinogen decarboxylase family protein [Candidatus Marinimicrobia bacterium]|nr:uroporphyrinogen decarboxylase family protein [Candidatus Neomarinimicrobiota bacterium]